MNKTQQTWLILILATIGVAITLILVFNYWRIVLVGVGALLVGYFIGYRYGRKRK